MQALTIIFLLKKRRKLVSIPASTSLLVGDLDLDLGEGGVAIAFKHVQSQVS